MPFRQGRVDDGEDGRGSSGRRPLCPPPLGIYISAPDSATIYISHFKAFLDLRRVAWMHRDGETLDFTDTRFGGKHDTALGAWRKRFQVFERNDVSFAASSYVLIDMPCIRCPEEPGYVTRLSALSVWYGDLPSYPINSSTTRL